MGNDSHCLIKIHNVMNDSYQEDFILNFLKSGALVYYELLRFQVPQDDNFNEDFNLY
jgi:hypothetical protein